MRTRFLAAACAAATVTGVTLACKDVPLLPKWDADFNLPLTSQGIALLGPFPATVPPGTAAPVSFGPLSQSLEGAIGTMLDQDLSNGRVIVTLTKALPVGGADTVFVSASRTATPTDTLAMTLLAADQSVTDTIPISSAGLNLLRSQASAKDSIFVRLSGRMSYNGSGNLTVTSADSIRVKLALLATIAVSR
jgi:hypothetical protein